LQQPFFFLIGPAAMLRLDRAKGTDLFVDAYQVLAEFLEAMELRDLLLRLAQGGRIGKGLGHAFACHSSGQTELWVMTGVIGFGAMAGRFTAAAHNGRDRTGPEITKAEKFFKESGSQRFKSFDSVRHGASSLNVIIRSEISRKKRKTAHL
jgi:hypothetical protein